MTTSLGLFCCPCCPCCCFGFTDFCSRLAVDEVLLLLLFFARVSFGICPVTPPFGGGLGGADDVTLVFGIGFQSSTTKAVVVVVIFGFKVVVLGFKVVVVLGFKVVVVLGLNVVAFANGISTGFFVVLGCAGGRGGTSVVELGQNGASA